LGSVDVGPPLRKRLTTTSSDELMKANSAPAMMLPLICGAVTFRNAFRRLTPRLWAARSWFISKPCRPDRAVMRTKGIASIVCARISPVSVLLRPTRANRKNTPTATTMRGIISGIISRGRQPR
jgi:hypothetical protein